MGGGTNPHKPWCVGRLYMIRVSQTVQLYKCPQSDVLLRNDHVQWKGTRFVIWALGILQIWPFWFKITQIVKQPRHLMSLNWENMIIHGQDTPVREFIQVSDLGYTQDTGYLHSHSDISSTSKWKCAFCARQLSHSSKNTEITFVQLTFDHPPPWKESFVEGYFFWKYPFKTVLFYFEIGFQWLWTNKFSDIILMEIVEDNGEI